MEETENQHVDSAQFSPDTRELLRLMAEHEVRYLLVGGRAVIYYGHSRMTGDVDIFYERSAENTASVFDALGEFWQGEIPGIDDPEELQEDDLQYLQQKYT